MSWLKEVDWLWASFLPHSYNLWLEDNSLTLFKIFLLVVAVVLIAVYVQKKIGTQGLKVETVEKIMGLKGPRFR